MENAAQALLIAAGVLIGLILISMMMVGYNEISNYYTTKEENIKVEQLADFNKEYIPYNRDDVRGTDLITLVNKIIDFNNLKEEEEIEISIRIPQDKEEKYKDFYYQYDNFHSNNVKLIKFNYDYNKDNIYNEDEFIKEATSIESKYAKYAPGMATKLVSNISTLLGENKRKTRRELLEELKIMKRNDTYANPDDYVDNEEILKYYQYIQFKRAHFDCTELTYTNEGRVRSFRFEFTGKFE